MNLATVLSLGFRELCFLICLLCYAAMRNPLTDYAYRISYYSTPTGGGLAFTFRFRLISAAVGAFNISSRECETAEEGGDSLASVAHSETWPYNPDSIEDWTVRRLGPGAGASWIVVVVLVVDLVAMILPRNVQLFRFIFRLFPHYARSRKQPSIRTECTTPKGCVHLTKLSEHILSVFPCLNKFL